MRRLSRLFVLIPLLAAVACTSEKKDNPPADTTDAGQEVGDKDNDGIKDDTDNCPTVSNHDQADRDHDGLGDLCDNCKFAANVDQKDTDNDGTGDACEPSCANAVALTSNSSKTGTLANPAEDKAFYKLSGTEGESVAIFGFAKPDTDGFDPATLDLVVTVYDSNGTMVAQNGFPTPHYTDDPSLFTTLPATGDYCVEVADCHSVFDAERCGDLDAITNKKFGIYYSTLDESWTNYAADAEPNDTAENATVVPYEKNTNGQYLLSIVGGALSSGSDVDVYKIHLPADTTVETGHALGNFAFQKAGASENGSTLTTLTAEISLASAPTDVLGRISLSENVQELNMPMDLDTDYLLTIRRNGGTAGANDFYYILHYAGGSNPLETEEGTGENDTLETAQALPFEEDTTSAFIEGDLRESDVDYFTVDVPAGSATVSVFCGAQTLGSGLRDFHAALVTADDSEVSGGNATETATAGIEIKDVAVPTGAEKLSLKLSAMSQAADVASSFYRCGVSFADAE